MECIIQEGNLKSKLSSDSEGPLIYAMKIKLFMCLVLVIFWIQLQRNQSRPALKGHQKLYDAPSQD
jgi:hypothetical protein